MLSKAAFQALLDSIDGYTLPQLDALVSACGRRLAQLKKQQAQADATRGRNAKRKAMLGRLSPAGVAELGRRLDGHLDKRSKSKARRRPARRP